MITNEENQILLNILNFIYPNPHEIQIKDDNFYKAWFCVMLNNSYVCSGFYRKNDIFFSRNGDDNMKYLINKLIELNVGVMDICWDTVTLVLYKDLKNLNI